MKKKWILGLVCVLTAALLGVTGAVAANVGSQEDPLVTYSYLNDTFKNEVLAEANGGFVLVYGGIEENCSFEAMFAAQREKLQDQVHAFLFA